MELHFDGLDSHPTLGSGYPMINSTLLPYWLISRDLELYRFDLDLDFVIPSKALRGHFLSLHLLQVIIEPKFLSLCMTRDVG